MKLGSLFDGIGGFPKAGIKYGFEPVWASEIEPFPVAVTKIRFPGMKHFGDITKINGAEIDKVEVITGGSPCQDLSVAGKRAGLEGERSGLFMEQVRIVKEMREHDRATGRTDKSIRPRFMVWENVPGAFSSNAGEDFRIVLEETARIADETITIPRPRNDEWNTAGAIMGRNFSIAWRVLDAQYWGVPQRRRRIFLVADFAGQSAPEILFKRTGLQGDIAESRKEGEGATSDAERSTGTTSGLITYEVPTEVTVRKNDVDTDGLKQCLKNHKNLTNKQIAEQLGKPLTLVEHWFRTDKSFSIPDPESWMQLKKLLDIQTNEFDSQITEFEQREGVYEKAGRIYDADGVSPTITSAKADELILTKPIIFEPRSQDGVPRIHDDVVPTLNTAQGGQRQPCICLQGSMIGRTDKNGPQGDGINEDVSFTLNATDRHAVLPVQKVYAICSNNSNSMKSDNPNSGIYEAETTRTLDMNGGNSACNQGGMMLVHSLETYHCENFVEKASTLKARDYKDPQCVTQPTYALDRASFNQGENAQFDFQITDDDKTQTVISRGPNAVANPPSYTVRRLTPLECERLQGFPDYWTDIPGASDSARYKALGNSVAIPCVEYVLEGIAQEIGRETG